MSQEVEASTQRVEEVQKVY
jgi:hypothetical protein